MASGNFDNEIKNAMSSKSDAKGGSAAPNAGKRPPPSPMKAHSNNAIPKQPPSQFQYKPPQQQADGQEGLNQATDQFGAHMAPHNPAQPQQSNLQQAHAQIVTALSNRDMLKGH